ncbi:MAG: endonuclease III domain-containing protein [Janthinobacterium lividum]
MIENNLRGVEQDDVALTPLVVEEVKDWIGSIWLEPEAVRTKIVERVCKTLEQKYDRPRLGNPERSIDDFIYIIISNRTSPVITQRVYANLRKRYCSWEDILSAPRAELQTLLMPAGLSVKKSVQIEAALRKIKQDFGHCDLNSLQGKPEAEVHSYLTSLPGVSDKVAKCVMMYTLDAEVLPVDSHVYRVSKRLGWTSKKQANQSHEELEALVPPQFRYAFHVDCIVHGRSVCRPKEPCCEQCCVRDDCKYNRSSN